MASKRQQGNESAPAEFDLEGGYIVERPAALGGGLADVGGDTLRDYLERGYKFIGPKPPGWRQELHDKSRDPKEVRRAIERAEAAKQAEESQ